MVLNYLNKPDLICCFSPTVPSQYESKLSTN